MDQPQRLLIQFSKWPRPGKVKTRLASSIGNVEATRVHIELANEVGGRLSGLSGMAYQLWLDQVGEDGDTLPKDSLFVRALNGQLPVIQQCGGDLGARMAHAFGTTLKEFDQVVVVGSDCPLLDESYIRRAFCLLDSHDGVVGPAEDGGYVLIGMCSYHPALFEDIAWGEASVLAETLARAEQYSIRIANLKPLWDVDTYPEYVKWRAIKGETDQLP